MDVHDKATRSKNMRAIGQRDTAIEKRLAALLAQAGFTFTVQDATLPGRPDFVVPEYRCAIFMRLLQDQSGFRRLHGQQHHDADRCRNR